MNCVITNNVAFGAGGGIDCSYAVPLIVNCLVAGNEAFYWTGGGIGGTAHVYGCTIVGNHSFGGSGGGVGGPIQIHSSILWANHPDQATVYTNIQYSDVQGGDPGTGNIDANPLFVDPAADDYHLQAGSPCIDAGDPAYVSLPGEVDLDAQRRVWDGNADGQTRVDMGVDEYGSFVFGDLNCDGAVNFGDINPFVLALSNPAGYAAAFPDCNIMTGDVNGDGHVNFGDINPFVALLSGS
jgi:hypothetical protein